MAYRFTWYEGYAAGTVSCAVTGTDREEEPVPSGGTYATERVSWMVMQEEGEVPVVL